MSELPNIPVTDLPLQPTALIGRERDRDAILAALAQEDTRLVTLTGPGGIGKTRLALDVAANLADRYPDGVILVSLAPVRDPELVLPSIAQAVGVRESTGLSAREGIEAQLRGKRLLLLLDNLEHLLAAATDFAWLLANCAGIDILATSQARLHIRGEHEFPVLPLPLPDTERPESISENPAVVLFALRVGDVDRTFALDSATLPVVAEICRRLDGIPLAIEMAAARVKVLPVSALLIRLERRLPLLTSGARDLPDRLPTMRGAIAWSYDLLDVDLQALFRRLCIFSGGFTLHEAETLIGTFDFEHDIVDNLARLADTSFLRQVERDGEPRFQMLETLREFGLEQLHAADEADDVASRHTDLFLTFAEAAAQRLRGAERTTWLERLERAHPNLRAALTWTTENHKDQRAARLAGALWQFWWWRSHLSEGRQWLEKTLALPDIDDVPEAKARVLTGCGALAETQGDYEAAARYHERAEFAWHATGNTRGLAVSLLFRWLVSFNADDQEGMAALSTESLGLFRELGDPWGIAMSLMEQGVAAMRRRDHAAAEIVLAEGIAGFDAIRDEWGVAICQGVLGNVATDQGDYERAAGLLSGSLTALLVLNDLWGVATVLPAASRMAGEQGHLEWAVRLSGAIARMHETMGAPLKVPFRVRYEENLAAARAAMGEERFAEAFAAGQAMSPEEAVAEARRSPQSGKPAAVVPARQPIAAAAPLSPREREVLRLVPDRTARQIGEELFISESTVRTHIENILNKLGLSNQKALVAYVYQHGLI